MMRSRIEDKIEQARAEEKWKLKQPTVAAQTRKEH